MCTNTNAANKMSFAKQRREQANVVDFDFATSCHFKWRMPYATSSGVCCMPLQVAYATSSGVCRMPLQVAYATSSGVLTV